MQVCSLKMGYFEGMLQVVQVEFAPAQEPQTLLHSDWLLTSLRIEILVEVYLLATSSPSDD